MHACAQCALPGSDFGGHIGLGHEIGHHGARTGNKSDVNVERSTVIPVRYQYHTPTGYRGTSISSPGYGSTYDPINSTCAESCRNVQPNYNNGASSAIPLQYNTSSSMPFNYAIKDDLSPRGYPESSSRGRSSFEDVYHPRRTAAYGKLFLNKLSKTV